MLDSHHAFWNQWSRHYQGFSETIEPYRAAQRSLAEGAVIALDDAVTRPALTVLDVGGGAGNLIGPMLTVLARKRRSLAGVHYVLTDGAKDMTTLAEARLPSLRSAFPEVDLTVLHADTLADGFEQTRAGGPADLVVSSWNIEYYPPDLRLEIIRRLAHLAGLSGVVAFSSLVQLPQPLTLREVLMPLGQAQVLQAFLTGGPGRMRKVIASLRQIADFGTAVSAGDFPEKPTREELKQLAAQAGLHPVATEYQLFGTSVMVFARKDGTKLAALPRTAISSMLVGRPGYEDHTAKVTFGSYFRDLLRNPSATG